MKYHPIIQAKKCNQCNDLKELSEYSGNSGRCRRCFDIAKSYHCYIRNGVQMGQMVSKARQRSIDMYSHRTVSLEYADELV